MKINKTLKAMLAIIMIASCVFFTACGSKPNSNNSSADPAASDEYINDSNEAEDEDIDEDEEELKVATMPQRKSKSPLSVKELEELITYLDMEVGPGKSMSGWKNYTDIAMCSRGMSKVLIFAECKTVDDAKYNLNVKKASGDSAPQYLIDSKTTDNFEFYEYIIDNSDYFYLARVGNTVLYINANADNQPEMRMFANKINY